MRAEIYWVATGRLAVLPRPRGGDWLEDEIQSLKGAGVDVLVSLLTKQEEEELDLIEEANLCAVSGLQFITFAIEDRQVPASGPETLKLVQTLAGLLTEGKAVAVHCRQG